MSHLGKRLLHAMDAREAQIAHEESPQEQARRQAQRELERLAEGDRWVESAFASLVKRMESMTPGKPVALGTFGFFSENHRIFFDDDVAPPRLVGEGRRRVDALGSKMGIADLSSCVRLSIDNHEYDCDVRIEYAELKALLKGA